MFGRATSGAAASRVLAVALVIAVACTAPVCVAKAGTLPPDVVNGVTWLKQQIQSDGSLAGESSSIATGVQVRAEVAQTLAQLDTVPTAVVNAAQTDPDLNAEYLSRRIITLSLAGQDASSLVTTLLTYQNPDGGFGSYAGYSSSPLETAWALLALKAAGGASASVLSNALQYLTGAANSDGAFDAFQAGSDAYTTGKVTLALQSYAQVYPLTAPIHAADAWLTSTQRSGVYGDTLSDAVATLALTATTTDSSAYSGLVQALQAAQLADGSWNDDPYLTAIALRALAVAGIVPAAPTTGQLSGQVVDASTLAPLAGVTVQLAQQSGAIQTTDSSGRYSLTSLAPGSYTLTASITGYASQQLAVSVTSGATTDAPLMKLSAIPPTVGVLQGTIVDGGTGQPLAGVLITVDDGGDSATATSGANGSYQIGGLAPGSITVTASIAGYQDASGGGQIVAGGTLLFSPTEYPDAAVPPSTATLTGTVVDAGTGQPITGATVSADGQSATTDSQGDFSVAGLEPGSFTASISASGYDGGTLSGSLTAGTDSIGVVRLAAPVQPPTLTTSSVSGTVTAGQPATAMAGATVSVKGTALVATTDGNGHYTISGISTQSFEVDVSAPGYIGQSVLMPGPGFNNYAANFALNPSESSGLAFADVGTGSSSYDPYSNVQIDGTIENQTNSAISLLFTATIYDANHNVVATVPAKGLVLGQTLSNALQTVGAQSTLPVSITWGNLAAPGGLYSAVIDASTADGTIVAEGATAFSINSVQSVGGGITLNPPIATAGVNQTVAMSASVLNNGNLALPAGPVQLQVVLTTPDPSAPTQAPANVSPWVDSSLLGGPVGAFFDTQGNFYTLSTKSNSIMEIAPAGAVSAYVQLPTIYGSAVDFVPDSSGDFLVGMSNGTVLKVSPALSITPISTGLIYISAVGVDSLGNLYVTGTKAGVQTALVRIDTTGQATTLISNGLSYPVGAVGDASGNLYVTNEGDGTISKISPSGQITPFASGLRQPQGITEDGQGNLYVANSGTGSIVKVSPAGTLSTYATGLKEPYDLSFDSSGDLLVTDTSANAVDKILPDGTVTTFARSVANSPEGMAYDASGDLYIANDNGTMTELASNGTMSVVSTGLSSPRGVAVDSSGNAFVANAGSGTISEISGTTTTTLASGLVSPYGLTFDSGGNLYVSQSTLNRISQVGSGGALTTVAASLVNSPQAVLVDSQGVTYVLNRTFISRIPSFDTAGSVLVSGFGSATRFALANGGGFYVLDGTAIKKVDPAGNISTVATVPYSNSALVTDSSGNLYFTNYFNRTLIKLDSSGNQTTVATLPANPIDVVLDGNGGFYVLAGDQIFDVSSAGAVNAIATGINSGNSLALGANGTLYVGCYGSVAAVSPAGQVTTFLSGFGGTVAVGASASGAVLLADPNLNRLEEYDAQGTLQDYLDGINGPLGIAWDGTRLLVASGSGVYGLVPGQNPKLLTSLGSQGYPDGYIAYANGVIYATTHGGVVYESINDAPFRPFFSGADLYYATGIAVRADGAVTIANQNDSRVLTVNSAQQVVASYAGIAEPTGIAVDSADDVYVGSAGQSEIIKISPSASSQSSVFATSINAMSMAFDANGNLLANTGGYAGIYSFDVTTGAKTQVVANTPSGRLFQLGNTTYLVDEYGAAVDTVTEGQLQTFAAGLNSPRSIRLGPDGSVYVANEGNGVVVRYLGGALSDFAGNIPGAQALALTPGGSLYVATTAGDIVGVAPGGQKTDFGISGTNMGNLSGVAVGPSGELSAVSGASGWGTAAGQPEVFQVTPPQAIAAPAPGTVILTRSAEVPALAVGDPAGAAVDFGSWVPQAAGDYSIAVTPTTPGVGGRLTNVLHVGPHATGQILATPSVVSPGNQPVTLTAQVTGADFESFSTVEASDLQQAAQTSAYPFAMGADTNGNIYFVSTVTYESNQSPNSIWRISGGTSAIFGTLPGTATITSRGSIPIDPQNDVYVGASDDNIYELAPNGTATVVAHLPTGIVSIALTSTDNLIVLLTNGSVDSVSPGTGGAPATIGAIPGTPYSMTVDGQDDIYVQTGNYEAMANSPVYELRPNGSVVELASDTEFEDEGTNITGDCANNLFLTPFSWPSQGLASNEEHVVFEVIGSTGKVGQIFDGATSVDSTLQDIDFIVYDRYGERLLIWSDTGQGRIYSMPVTCGAIGAQLHVVLPSGQTASGFNIAPTSTLTQSDGSTDYEWNLQSVTALGQNVTFSTTLNGLTVGQSQPVAKQAYLQFTNSFSNQPLTLDLTIPQVQVASGGALSVSTDQSTYPAATAVAISSIVSDTASPGMSGTVSLVIQDASGATVATVNSIPFGPLAQGAQTTLAASWNTSTVLAGQYQVYARMLDSSGDLLGTATAPFTIAASGGTSGSGGTGSGTQVVSVRTTTDRQVYNTTDQVQISDLVQDLSANEPESGTTLEVQITSPAGQVVSSQTVSLGQLMPGGSSEPLVTYSFTAAAQGTYQVSGTVLDASGNVLATASAAYQVLENPAQTLKGSATAQLASLYVGQSQMCTDTITNGGTEALSALALQQLVVRLDQSATISTTPQSVNLAAGAAQQLEQGFSTAGFAPGEYACVLQAQTNGAWQTLGYVAFKVTVPPIQINATLGLGPKGRVLVLLDDTPQRACGPIQDIELWAAFHTQLPPDARVSVELLDANGNAVDSESVTLASFRGDVHRSPGGGASLVIEGISPDVITIDVRGATALAPGYQVEVTANGSSLPPMTLETGVMGSACGWPMGAGTHFGDFECDHVSPYGSAPSVPSDQEPTPDQRRTFLKSLLQQAGWSYTIVTDEESFEQAMRSGAYGEYALLAERWKLDDQMQKEVREAINRGDGLLDGDEQDVDEQAGLTGVLGLEFAGRQPNATSVDFLGTGGLTETGTTPLAFPSDVLCIRVGNAQVAGVFPIGVGDPGRGRYEDAGHEQDRFDWEGGPDCSGQGWSGFNWGNKAGPGGQGSGGVDAAVTTNSYGQGQSVFAAYDLLAETTQAGSSSLQASALRDALGHIMPSFSDLHAGEVIPLHLSLQNQGIATSGQVQMTLPAGVTVADPGTATVNNGVLTWTYSLAVGQTLDFYTWVRLPDEAGETEFDSDIQTATNGTFTDYGQVMFTASADAYATLADALSLVGTASDLRPAEFWLQTAQWWLNRNDPEYALASLLEATDELLGCQSPQAVPLRLDVDQAIWTLEQQISSQNLH